MSPQNYNLTALVTNRACLRRDCTSFDYYNYAIQQSALLALQREAANGAVHVPEGGVRGGPASAAAADHRLRQVHVRVRTSESAAGAREPGKGGDY